MRLNDVEDAALPERGHYLRISPPRPAHDHGHGLRCPKIGNVDRFDAERPSVMSMRPVPWLKPRRKCGGASQISCRSGGFLPDTNYPAEIQRDEDGRFVVAFPDFGWGATDGASRDEALAEAKDLLRELITTTMREGKDLPEPSRAGERRPLVIPPVQIALKAALYEAWRQAGISQRRLARDLDVAESEVRRMLNPEHGTKAATIDRALRRLGKRVTVTVGEAA